MKTFQITSFVSLVFITSLMFGGCNQSNTTSSAPTNSPVTESATITVSAAASLQDALEDIKPLYNKEKALLHE